MAVKRAVICASPHVGGICAQTCDVALRALKAAYPEDSLQAISLAARTLDGCIGCDQCRSSYECFRQDDMTKVLALLDEAEELYIASPIYFAGPPAQFKALLDRLQPRFWQWLDTPRDKRPDKRPARLLVIGAGGDPHGFEPLVVSARSALAVARFEITHVEASIADDAFAHVPAWLGVSCAESEATHG